MSALAAGPFAGGTRGDLGVSARCAGKCSFTSGQFRLNRLGYGTQHHVADSSRRRPDDDRIRAATAAPSRKNLKAPSIRTFSTAAILCLARTGGCLRHRLHRHDPRQPRCVWVRRMVPQKGLSLGDPVGSRSPVPGAPAPALRCPTISGPAAAASHSAAFAGSRRPLRRAPRARRRAGPRSALRRAFPP